MRTCGDRKLMLGFFPQLPLHLIWDKISHWTWSMPIRLNWMARYPPGPLVFTLSVLKLQTYVPMLGFYVGTWVQNSSPLACTADTLPMNYHQSSIFILRQSLTKLPKECSYLWSYSSVPSRWDYRYRLILLASLPQAQHWVPKCRDGTQCHT